MELEKELQESIKKNLPQQVGEVLKTRLEQADIDAQTVKSQKERIEAFNIETKNFQREIELYMKFDERNAVLDTREKELETEKNTFEIEKLKYQLQSEKDKTEFSKNVALGLVRNIDYRKTMFDSENLGGIGIVDGQGNYHYPLPTSKSYTSTETQE